MFCCYNPCGGFEGRLITSILGDRSESRGDDSTFPSSAAGLGFHPHLNGKEEEADGSLRTRVRRDFQRRPLLTSFTGLLLFQSFFLFRTNRNFQLLRCARARPRLLVNYFSCGPLHQDERRDRSLGISLFLLLL